MRKGGFGALLAFTVAILMFNGQGGSSTSSAAGSRSSATNSGGLAAATAHPAATETNGGSVLEQGICRLQPPDYTQCGSCGGFCPSDDLRGAIKAFFVSPTIPGSPAQPDASCELPSHSTAGQNAVHLDMRGHWCVPADFRGHLKFVVASIPDPAHTHLSVLSDRVLEAIMEGAQASDYLFARSSLPWENQTFPESDDYLSRSNASDWQSEREKLPGLLIFRKAFPRTPAEATQALFVFVVGERPTGGLNKQQFQSALQIMAAIRDGAKDRPADDPLLVLGPDFSGSLYSLEYLLENDPAGTARRAIVHSGSVSSYQTIRWFQNFPRTRTLDFRTFLESDEYQLARFLQFAVCEQHYRPADIAVVEEDETAYGGGRNPSLPEKSPLAMAEQDSKSREWPTAPTRIGCPNDPFGVAAIANYFYPRDISHLRSAYQQQTQTAAASDAGRRAPRNNLPLNIEDTGSDDDSVPTYSPGQTPLSEESVLLGIVASLHKQHAKFIILVATNTLDEIFLSQYMLRAYPEGRIVTFDEDLLLSREVDDPRFQGILSVTSYPLFPVTKDNVARALDGPSEPAQHEFPWDTSVGTFNAMVSLLRDPSPSCDRQSDPSGRSNPPDKCKDLPSAAYAEYGWPALGGNSDSGKARKTLAPPLWLTVIGNDGYWPLSILDSNSYAQIPGAPQSVLHAVNSEWMPAPQASSKHKPWELLCLFFIALSLIHTYLRWTGSILSRTKIAANFAPVDDSYCSYGLFIADVLLFIVFFLLLAPWIYFHSNIADLPLGIFLSVVLIFLLISSVADQIRRKSNRLAISSAIAFVLAFAILAPFTWDPVSSRNLFFYRFVHITSGVSPLIPFLILAFAGLWCAWYTLAGLVLTDERGPVLPEESQFESEPAGARHASVLAMRFRPFSRAYNRDLLEVLHPASLKLRVILLPFLAIVLALFVVDYGHPVRGLEGSKYNWLYFGSLGIVLLILLCDLCRLIAIWIEFRVPLVGLNRLPLRRSFSCLKELKGKSLWQLSGSAFDDFFPILGREMESLRKLKDFLGNEDALHKVIETTEKVTQDLVKVVMDHQEATRNKKGIDLIHLVRHNPTREIAAALVRVHKSLAHSCAAALLYLHPRWNAETHVPGELPEPPEPTTESRLKKTVTPQSTLLAEEFVCLFYYNFISTIFLRMRTLLMSVAGMFVLLVLSFNSYPFQPASSYHTLTSFVLILIVAVVSMVMGQMHRDPTLSHITNTTPGQLGWDFWLRMASFVALPLFTLLASQFPQIGSFLYFWAQPALNSFK